MAKESARVETHFIDTPAPNEMRVKKFFVPEGKGSPYEIEYVIPLEFIMRYYVAGSLFDRLKEGTLKPDDVGLNHMPKYGEELDDPFFEVTTKYEKFDRVLTRGEAIEIGGMTGTEINNIRETILAANRAYTIIIDGSPSNFKIRIGVADWLKDMRNEVTEPFFANPMMAYLEVPEALWSYELEHQMWHYIETQVDLGIQ